MDAAASSAACSRLNGGCRRVLTLPGTVSLAITTRVGHAGLRGALGLPGVSCSREPPGARAVPGDEQTRHVVNGCERAADRPRHLGPADSRCIRGVDLADAPSGVARAKHHLKRVAAASDRGGRARGGPHGVQRASVRDRVIEALSPGASGTRATGWRCERAAAIVRCRRTAAAEHQVELPGEHRVDDEGKVSRIHRRISVTERDDGRCRRLEPALTADPNPRRGSCTTVAPCSRATSTERSVDPLSTTIARYPAGRRVSTNGRAFSWLRHGKTTSTRGVFTVRPSAESSGVLAGSLGSVGNGGSESRCGKFTHAGIEADRGHPSRVSVLIRSGGRGDVSQSPSRYSPVTMGSWPPK